MYIQYKMQRLPPTLTQTVLWADAGAAGWRPLNDGKSCYASIGGLEAGEVGDERRTNLPLLVQCRLLLLIQLQVSTHAKKNISQMNRNLLAAFHACIITTKDLVPYSCFFIFEISRKLNACALQCVPGVPPRPSSKSECLGTRLALDKYKIGSTSKWLRH